MSRDRDAANVLLDAVTAFDHEQGETPQNEAAIHVAFQRLTEVDAIRVVADEAGEVHVNISPVLSGATALLTLLIRRLAEDHNADPDAVVAVLRETLEESIFPD